jgi:hypothetical protein
MSAIGASADALDEAPAAIEELVDAFARSPAKKDDRAGTPRPRKHEGGLGPTRSRATGSIPSPASGARAQG